MIAEKNFKSEFFITTTLTDEQVNIVNLKNKCGGGKNVPLYISGGGDLGPLDADIKVLKYEALKEVDYLV